MFAKHTVSECKYRQDFVKRKIFNRFFGKNPIFVLPNFKVGRPHSGRSDRRRSPARIVPAGGAAPSAGDADRRKPIFETNKNDSPK